MNRRQTKGKVGPVPMTMVNVKDGIPQKSIEARGIVLIASSRFRSINTCSAKSTSRIKNTLVGSRMCIRRDFGTLVSLKKNDVVLLLIIG